VEWDLSPRAPAGVGKSVIAIELRSRPSRGSRRDPKHDEPVPRVVAPSHVELARLGYSGRVPVRDGGGQRGAMWGMPSASPVRIPAPVNRFVTLPWRVSTHPRLYPERPACGRVQVRRAWQARVGQGRGLGDLQEGAECAIKKEEKGLGDLQEGALLGVRARFVLQSPPTLPQGRVRVGCRQLRVE
jgi:hypothetical protein